jgi:hypothetical protein
VRHFTTLIVRMASKILTYRHSMKKSTENTHTILFDTH